MSKIIRLSSENFKRLVAVDITPTGNMVVLSGKNRQGKTSILDAMFAVLKGAKFAKETSQTIRDGQDHAWVRLEIGDDAEHVDMIATRRWSKEDSGTLTVEAADGAGYSSPQTVLDKIAGEISFDPQSFIDLTREPAKQVDALVKALGDALPFDPVKLAAERKGVYDRRTEIGREVTKLEGQLTGYPSADASLPADEVSASTVLTELEAARENNARIDSTVIAGERIRARVDQAREALRAAEAEMEAAGAAHRDWEQQAANLPDMIDASLIGDKLTSLEQTNARIRQEQQRRAIDAQLQDRKNDVAALTLKLRNIDKQKADGIAAAKFPVPELSFGDDGVTYDGRAFSQASTEEQYRASFGVAIAANPKLRVCRIDRGEALDSDSLKVIGELAAEHDMQVWISRVTDGGGIGFVIEEGTVQS